MRKRIRALIAVLGIAVAVLRARRARVRAGDDAEPKLRERGGEGVLREARRRASRSTTARRRRRRWCPEQRDHLGLAGVPGAARRRCGSAACRRCKNMEQAREDRIRNDLEGPRQAQDRGRGREGAVPRADRRRHGRGRPHHRRGAAVGRAGAPRPDRAGRGRGGRDPRRGPQADIANQRNAGDGRSCAPTSPRCRSTSPSRIVERNLDSDTQPPARRQLHRPGREQLGRWPTASTSTRRRCSRSPRPRATSTRSKTSCSASRASSRATTTCAWRSPTRACRSTGGPRSSTSCSRTARCRSRGAIAAFIVGAGRGHDLPGDRRPVRRARRAEPRARGRRGALRGRRSTTRRSSGIAEALVAGRRGKNVEVKVVVDEPVMGGHRRHHRRHGDRRHRPSPSRSVEGDASKWPSSPSTRPTSRRSCARTSRASTRRSRREQVGRVLEVGDGIARVAGPAQRRGQRAARVRRRRARASR